MRVYIYIKSSTHLTKFILRDKCKFSNESLYSCIFVFVIYSWVLRNRYVCDLKYSSFMSQMVFMNRDDFIVIVYVY